ncbi:hypothetical protein [Enterococcus ratti]|uniref:Uncharacterized protein n=1 Tax=Enterococcus ratti TaxID=150033 RepID=A0A1L8WP96_9ENTE|nr:hypothetical protein [Enterococcus ratti]OJG82841.1 hypothetical protein RV14_GL002133 [Enterococcus ratti]
MSLNIVDLSNKNGSKNVVDYPADAYMFKASAGCNFVDKYCDQFVQQAIKANKPDSSFFKASLLKFKINLQKLSDSYNQSSEDLNIQVSGTFFSRRKFSKRV